MEDQQMFFKDHHAYQLGNPSMSDPVIRLTIDFQGLTEDDLNTIRSSSDVCRRSLDTIIDAYQDRLERNDDAESLTGKNGEDSVRPNLSGCTVELFDGMIDGEFIAFRNSIGDAAAGSETDFQWFVALYEAIRRSLGTEVHGIDSGVRDLTRFREAMIEILDVDRLLVPTLRPEKSVDFDDELTVAMEQESYEVTRQITKMSTEPGVNCFLRFPAITNKVLAT
jgi:hypothetical protein